jgi:hypothetical protein
MTSSLGRGGCQRCTNAWFWFAPPYRLYSIFESAGNDEIHHYAISIPGDQVLEFDNASDSFTVARIKFERLPGVDITEAL